MAYEDYNIQQFMNAWFKGDRSEMDDETFRQVHTEYVDTTGLYESEEFDRVAYITYINGRVNKVKIWIKLQKEFIELFDKPCIPAFDRLNEIGYNIKWEDDKEKFLQQINFIEVSERKYITILEMKIKELKDLREKKDENIEPEKTIKQSRESFLRTYNSLGKIGYKLSKTETTVEEYSLMIKQQKEENERIKTQT